MNQVKRLWPVGSPHRFLPSQGDFEAKPLAGFGQAKLPETAGAAQRAEYYFIMNKRADLSWRVSEKRSLKRAENLIFPEPTRFAF